MCGAEPYLTLSLPTDSALPYWDAFGIVEETATMKVYELANAAGQRQGEPREVKEEDAPWAAVSPKNGLV